MAMGAARMTRPLSSGMGGEGEEEGGRAAGQGRSLRADLLVAGHGEENGARPRPSIPTGYTPSSWGPSSAAQWG
jgi:hypothetical protein